MTRNLKALGLALMAVFAMSALAAQGASATVNHEFHSDGPKTIVTGTNDLITTNGANTETTLSPHEFTVGTKGIVKCNLVETESTQTGTEVSAGTYKSDTITVIPHYTECTFGGNPATVDFGHCAYVFYSETTEGNTTEVPPGSGKKGEHANVEIECSGGSEIKITTTLCTITVGAQLIKHAVKYENDKHNENAVNVIATAHNVVVGNLNDKAGCLTFPKGAVGKYIGTTTGTCYRDDDLTTPEGTEKTTPPVTKEGPETRCTVSPGA